MIEVRQVRDAGALREVWDLVAQRYTQYGYKVDADPTTPFPDAARAPHYTTWAAYQDGVLRATVTMGVDSEHGLLVDEDNKEIADALRASGARLCEMTRFAAVFGHTHRLVLKSLFSEIDSRFVGGQGLTDMLVEVNPKHAGFYTRTLGFKPISGLKVCPRAGGPSVLMKVTNEDLHKALAAFTRQA